jgi:hypothetical protein
MDRNHTLDRQVQVEKSRHADLSFPISKRHLRQVYEWLTMYATVIPPRAQ